MVRLLCGAGADKDKARPDGATALYIASQNGHLEVARLLCEAGADMDKCPKRTWLPFMVACLSVVVASLFLIR
eukprot:6518149-Heterocapsa_arctica.AAC.1